MKFPGIGVAGGIRSFLFQRTKREELHYADQIQNRKEIKLVVVDLSTSANVDLAGARMLAELEEYLTQAGISLKLAETHGDVRDVLHAQGWKNESREPGRDRTWKLSSKTGEYPRWVVSSDDARWTQPRLSLLAQGSGC